MIKRILLALPLGMVVVALLWAVVYASPTATLSVQIVPAQINTGPVACDVGPNAPSIPAPAAAAGFNHCRLNFDVTQNVTDGNGINWQNPNTWAYECSGQTLAPNSQSPGYMHLVFQSDYNPVLTPADCGRIQSMITTDPTTGGTVFDPYFLPSDASNNERNLSWMWPSSEWGALNVPGGCCLPAGGPDGFGLSDQYYVEITYRVPEVSWNTNGADYLGLDWWMDECNGCSGVGGYSGTSGGEPEVDFFEMHASEYSDGSPGSGTIPYNGFATGNPNTGQILAFNVDNYHTAAYLLTSDGTPTGGGNLAECMYFDGAVAFSPCNENRLGPNGAFTNGKILSLWSGPNDCYDGNAPPCGQSRWDVYIQSIRFFTCDTFWQHSGVYGGCTGTLVTQGETHTNFAWLGKAWDGFISLVLGRAAHADQFDPFDDQHLDGYWVCPNGVTSNKWCRPHEFDVGEWWKSCLAARSDCVWSETAFIGREGKPESLRNGLPSVLVYHAIRGPGYCYTGQRFTCSPSGKVP